MGRNRTRAAVKKGSPQAKNFITRMQHGANKRMQENSGSAQQMMLDAFALALHEVLGFSGLRIIRVIKSTEKYIHEIASLMVQDEKCGDIEYSKTVLDRALQQAYGKNYPIIPFNERYS